MVNTKESVHALFPADLEQMLQFDEGNTYVLIKPRQFLGSENFAKIASVIRNAGGEYVSAGKESHFRIPINPETTPLTPPTTQPQKSEEPLPRVYRKGNTVVVKMSKATLATTTWWAEGKAFLHTISNMAKDGSGNILRDGQNNPIWDKKTIRLSRTLLAQFITELSKLYNETKGTPNVPTRQ